MSSTEFRHIENRSGPDKPDKLFRAAVSAFCALTRPAQREIAQLDDLASPLLAGVSREGRRFAAAALSECESPPPLLIRRLANDLPDVAAPILIRSKALREADLVICIAKCGKSHARIIARRPHLSKPIIDLLKRMRDPEIDRLRSLFDGDGAQRIKSESGDKAEATRKRLRAMMEPADFRIYHDELRRAALTGRLGLFQTRLADALGLNFEMVRLIGSSKGLEAISVALRAMALETEQAFLMLAAVYPGRFPDAAAIRQFVRIFERHEVETARKIIRQWKTSVADEIFRERKIA